MDDAARERKLARFYDLEYAGYMDDVEFYVQHALAMDPEKTRPLLELGCGTGRVLVPLAEAGFRVVGVDQSVGMLEVCRERAERVGVAERVEVVRADVRDLSGVMGGPFNLAFCALNTFAYLRTTQEQVAMLRSLHPLLVQHGVLVLDLTPPGRNLLPPSDGEVLYQGSYPDAETGGVVHKFVSGYAEASRQLHHTRIFYDLEGPDGTVQRTSQEVTFRWTGRYEMELLLGSAGYRLEKVYGGYDLEEYGDDSERLIFVART